MSPLLSVRDLSVSFGGVAVTDRVSFDVEAGTTVGLVGESGSGKTVTALSAMGLTRAQGARVTGQVVFDGEDLATLNQRELSTRRGRTISMIFQQAIRTLDPAFTVGEQLAESVRRHEKVSRKEAWARAVAMLDRVHIPRAAERAREYPHTFSGGMSQRAMIAMALVCKPKLVFADEPTTALDVTVQARILDLLREIQRDTGIAVVFISHDLGVIAELAQQVVVMYAGQVVERAGVEELFLRPRHPYTAGLLNAIPAVGRGRRLISIPGNVPAPTAMPTGCRFHPRCPHGEVGRCDAGPVDLVEDVRCVRTGEVALLGIPDPRTAGVGS
jgi:peptide/nickel transport system ATP-binding protein/oligopeptide transport system ATP-binding protein